MTKRGGGENIGLVAAGNYGNKVKVTNPTSHVNKQPVEPTQKQSASYLFTMRRLKTINFSVFKLFLQGSIIMRDN